MNEQEKILYLNIDLLIPNKNQPRKVFNDESLKELSISIKEYGILNPILVRQSNDKYEIIAGERRFRAAKLAGLTEVPVRVKNIDDSQLAELALIENLQRENISPIEEAKTYEEILRLTSKTEQQLSEMIGKSQSFISNKLRLLKLPNNIQQALSQRKISERHARSLMTIEDKDRQTELLNKIINERLTVKELDNIINEKKITEDEIHTAINDIMKSLNISDESKEKEEKESDNMNNGNFFPNMNQNIPQGGQPATLNSMNMQTRGQVNNQQPITQMPEQQPTMMEPQPQQVTPQIDFGPLPSQENTMSQMNPIPNFSAPVSQTIEPSITPMADTPLFGGSSMEKSSVPNIELPQSEPTTVPFQPEPALPQMDFGSTQQQENMMPQIDTSLISDFSSQPSTINEEQTATTPMTDTPLFNSEANMTPSQEQETLNEPVYEVPVNATPAINVTNNPQEKLVQVQELLNSNGIEYKTYSNETNHCIIIEI